MDYTPRVDQYKAYHDVLKALSIYDRVVLQMPTRSGKGCIISLLVELAIKNDKSVLLLVDYGILFDGLKKELDKHGIKYGTIKQNYEPDQITIASKDTYINREKIEFDLCIVDEAHKSLSDTFQQAITAKKVVGVTATPDNLHWYQHIVKGLSVKDLQKLKIVSKTEVYSIDPPDLSHVDIVNGDYSGVGVVAELEKQGITGNAIEHYRRFADGKKGMIYCSTIAQSEDVAAEFTANGIPSVSITSKDKDREQKIADYYSGKYKLLISVNMFIAGFEIKECECIIWLRPTQSLIIWMQGNGRGMLYTGNPLIIIDPVGNLDRHDFVETPHDWQIGKKIRKHKKEVLIRTCEKCFKAFAPADICPFCGHTKTVKRRAELKKIDGELKLRTEALRKERNKSFKLQIRACQTVDEAGKLAVKCGYKYGYGYTYFKKVLRRV